jgi:SpoVK/Ycf46/Vps4 family AAA+-type ATPase
MKQTSKLLLFVCSLQAIIAADSITQVNVITPETQQKYRSVKDISKPDAEVESIKILPELLPRQVNEISLRLQIRHLLQYNNEKPVNTILFHGPPGLGKTEAAKQVAEDGGFNFINQPSTGLVNKYQNSGAEQFQEVINTALQHHTKTKQGSLIFLDEFDAIGKEIKDADATMVTNHQTELAALMHIWQTVIKYKDDPRLVFCFATNNMKSLHKTFISRLREEHIVEFKLPDAAQRKIALEYYLKKYDFSLAKELNIDEKQSNKVLDMLVKHSDSMNYRALRDTVASFKGQKSLSSLSNADIVNVLKHNAALKEKQDPELKTFMEELSKKTFEKTTNKVEQAIIALHEKLTGKPVAVKASTTKELYEILQRTKAKDGYDWKEAIKRKNNQLREHVDPWPNRVYTYLGLLGVAYQGYKFAKPYIFSPETSAALDQVEVIVEKIESIN